MDYSYTLNDLTSTSGYSNFILLDYRSIFVGLTTNGSVVVFIRDNDGFYYPSDRITKTLDSVDTAKLYFIDLIIHKLNELFN